MKEGKKSVAQKQVYKAFEIIKEKLKKILLTFSLKQLRR